MTSLYEDWWERYGFPLHAAIDAASELPIDTPIEKRFALIVEKCPWVREKFGATPPAADHDGEAIEIARWVDVEGSSNVEAYRYQPHGTPDTVRMEIRFTGGAIYAYDGVPVRVAIGIKDAVSVGKWVSATLINGGYTSTRVA